MAEPIEIIIRKGTGGDGSGFGIAGSNESKAMRGLGFGKEAEDFLKKNEQSGNKMLAAATAAALATLKKSINYQISQYGNMTGNYIEQAEMQLTLSVVQDIGGVVGATATGAMAGGPVGAVIGAVVGTTNLIVNKSFEYRTLQTNVAKLNTYANIMQERSGNMYNNGSRGTYQ